MKKQYLILVFIGLGCLFSCRQERYSAPDNLIGKEEMTEILYEILIYNTASLKDNGKLINADVELNEFIYKKFNIDSTQFADSNAYYASQPDVYIEIFKIIETRVVEEKRLNRERQEEIRAKKDSTARASNANASN